MEDVRSPILNKVRDREGEWMPLFLRMDTDKDLYNQVDFYLKNKDGRPTANVSNLTLNDAHVFASRVIATLNSANMQLVIEGPKLEETKAALLEKFFEGIYLAVDEDLSNHRDIIGLRPFLNEQLAIRGRAVTRVLLRTEGKDFIPEVLPCDARYTTFGMGRYGPKWVSYLTNRPKEDILSEYPGVEVRGPTGAVRDYWDEKVNEVYVDDTLAFEQPNKLGYPPYIITTCHRGSMLMDADALQHHAESIFASNRKLFNAKNEILSILMTQHKKLLKPPMQYKSRAGEQAQAPRQPLDGVGFVAPVELEGGYENMPWMDLQQAGRLLYAVVDGALQRGSLPAVDYGNLTFPLSAVAISKLTATRDMIFLPTLQAMAIHYRNQNKMVRNQFIAGGFKAELGKEGERQQYTSAEIKRLEGTFSCKYDITATSPEQDIANYSIAEAAQRWVSDETIMRDVLKLADPATERNKRMVEMAEKVSPFILKMRIARSLIEEGKELEAKLMAKEMGISWQQLKSGKIAPEERKNGQQQPKPESMLPLLGANQGGGMRPGRPSTPTMEEEIGVSA